MLNYEENENLFSSEVFDKLKEIIVEQLEVESDRVTLDSDVTQDLGADELDVDELIATIEEEFDIELNQEFAPAIRDLLNAVISEI
ncbi:MAG: phosphopantetheine-binding protein [Waterburya sp.]